MDNKPPSLTTPPEGWAEAIDESMAELVAGAPTVPAEAVHRRVRESIARIEAKRAAAAEKRRAPSRR